MADCRRVNKFEKYKKLPIFSVSIAATLKIRLSSLLLLLSLGSLPPHAQITGFPIAQGDKTDADAAIKRACIRPPLRLREDHFMQ